MSNEMQLLDSLGDAPARVVKSLEGASVEKLAALYKRAEESGLRAWMMCAICVGLALERIRCDGRARRQDKAAAADDLTKQFGIGRSHIQRFDYIYRLIIRPRLDADGSSARFPLGEQLYYIVATQGAHVVSKTPLALLEYAEEKRRQDPKFSSYKFRREILGEERANGRTRGYELTKIVRQLARIQPIDLEWFAEHVGADAWLPILDAASSTLEEAKARIATRAAA